MLRNKKEEKKIQGAMQLKHTSDRHSAGNLNPIMQTHKGRIMMSDTSVKVKQKVTGKQTREGSGEAGLLQSRNSNISSSDQTR